MQFPQPRSMTFENTKPIYTRTGKFKTQSMTQLRFYQILQSYTKQKPVRLNIPETVIQGFGVKRPSVLRTNPQGYVISREGLASPEYSPFSIINLLLTFSSQARPGVPCGIVKQEIKNKDCCMPLLTLKAGQIAWNRMLSKYQPVVVQRYIYNGTPCAFLLRVRFQPTLNNWKFQILQNTCAIESKSNAGHYSELNNFLNRTGKRQFKSGYTIVERFCVKTSSLTSFDPCLITPIDCVKSQVESLKLVLERGYLSLYDLSVLELEADFIQGWDAKWYFISLKSYKTEVTKKVFAKADVQELVSRLVLSKSQYPMGTCSTQEDTPVRQRHRTVMNNSSNIFERLLVSEIMEDLGVRRA